MRKLLNRKVKVSTILTLVLVVVGTLTLMAAVPAMITATLAPHITIKYNGVVQEMRDANGAIVTPVIIDGSTFLPLRAVANMVGLPVEWDGATNTVSLGIVRDDNWKPLRDNATVTTQNTALTTDSAAFAFRVDDFGNRLAGQRTYTTAIRHNVTTGANGSYGLRRFDVTFEGNFTEMTFDLALNGANGAIDVRVTNRETGGILYTATLNNGQFIDDVTLNIDGVRTLRVETRTAGAERVARNGAVWFLDPVVR
jgi:hypothetical protein